MQYAQLVSEVEQILSFVSEPLPSDLTLLVERGNTLVVYLARSTELTAEAKRALLLIRQQALADVVAKLADSKLSAKVQNALIDTLCPDQVALLTKCERLNAALTHQLDWIRSQISLAKTEMQLTNLGREFQ